MKELTYAQQLILENTVQKDKAGLEFQDHWSEYNESYDAE